MVKKILIGVVVLIALVVVVIATRPSTFEVERSITIAAPVEAVFPYAADFNKFAAYSPWEKLDPAMEKTIEGEPGTVGHSYAWKGNDQAGTGKMTITEIKPNESVKISLEFMEPFPAKDDTWWTFAADGEGTRATWAMRGHLDFMGKAACLVMDMPGMISQQYDEGLAKLKTAAEADAKKLAEAKAMADAAAAAPAEGAPAEGAPADAAPAEGTKAVAAETAP